jgi:magnesium chelatase subunit I
LEADGMQKARTLGELRRSGYRIRKVREEMRANLLTRLGTGERILPGIIGFDDTVIPELENAILAGHHIVLLGERGQAKSRILRGLMSLLDEEVPAVRGCPLNDSPEAPICKACRERVAAEGEDLELEWIGRVRRYGEKLATPDVSMADLVGEVDPIKVAEGRYLEDEDTIHFGLIPRTNRGIFAINELPDLTEKVQVGLFNLMEEKDVQIKGYKIQLPLDFVLVASANPEDYTSRGRIITPLKDRFDVQIRTHYPRRIEDEIAIMEQELPTLERFDRAVHMPDFLKEILAQLTFEARASSEINQASGVSVRASINNYESVLSNAEKRSVRAGESEIVPRISDLHAVHASMSGKIEIEYAAEEASAAEVVDRLLDRAVLAVFDRRVKVESLASVVQYFEAGWGVEVGDVMRSEEYLDGVRQIPGLREAIHGLGPIESPGFIAAASEFVFEGLHLHEKLNRNREGGRARFGM